VPYSDPLADGPVIQAASSRALKHGVTIVDCIRLAGQARQSGVTVPLILFSYFNPILQLGLDKTLQMAETAGIDGFIVPDLPLEEARELAASCRERGLALIPLVAPTSEQRIAAIVQSASGFIYCVSSLGVTGVRQSFHEGISRFLQQVRVHTALPLAVGFGVSTAEQVKDLSKDADGAVVGSALIQVISSVSEKLLNEETKEEGLAVIADYIRGLRS
jgi:tryptophan synthase alpha chain